MILKIMLFAVFCVLRKTGKLKNFDWALNASKNILFIFVRVRISVPNLYWRNSYNVVQHFKKFVLKKYFWLIFLSLVCFHAYCTKTKRRTVNKTGFWAQSWIKPKMHNFTPESILPNINYVWRNRNLKISNLHEIWHPWSNHLR